MPDPENYSDSIETVRYIWENNTWNISNGSKFGKGEWGTHGTQNRGKASGIHIVPLLRVRSLDTKHRIIGKIWHAPTGKTTMQTLWWAVPSLSYARAYTGGRSMFNEMGKECFIKVCLLHRDWDREPTCRKGNSIKTYLAGMKDCQSLNIVVLKALYPRVYFWTL